jgi:hypothetical protein
MNSRLLGTVFALALTALFNRVWKVERTGAPAAPGSIFIFLPNGTLLMTSCGEPYRIALWARDPKRADTIRLTEDRQPTVALRLDKTSGSSAQLTQTMIRSGEKAIIRLTAQDKEFVCPDLPK